MKRYLIGLMIFSSLLLNGCIYHRYTANLQSSPREAWMGEIENNPNSWMRGADNWFVIGNPNIKSMPAGYCPSPISSMNVKLPYFSKLKINGDFQVHIIGSSDRNSVSIEGPSDAVRSTLANVQGDTLFLSQIKRSSPYMSQVIITINVTCLNSLVQLGRGRIEGIQLSSDYLEVVSSGSGNIYLSGKINLQRLINLGHGCVNIFGAETSVLDIQTNGTGVTNVCGNVGVRSILHYGRTNINIIGANSNFLRIYANGSGKIGISGAVNLREVRAEDKVRVFVNKVMSDCLDIVTLQNGRVGLAGSARYVNLNSSDAGWIGARYLCANTAFARSNQRSHINVASNGSVFAAAAGDSSIYFFGPSQILTAFLGGSGTIVTIDNEPNCCPVLRPVVPVQRSFVSRVKTVRHKSHKVHKHHRRVIKLQGEG